MKASLRHALGLLVGLAIANLSVARPEPTRFKSPGGRFEVVFEEIEHQKYSEAEQRKDFDHTSRVKYRIAFYRSGEGKPVAAVEHRDVYGWERGAKPTPPADLFNAFVWSPKEDFAVLDEEGWARAPGAPERKAVALDPTLPWTTAPFRLSDPVWADALRVVGNSYNDCEYSVVMFDGATGKMQPIMAAASPIGYEIGAVTGRRVLIRRLLDNCKTEELEKDFVPECLSLDLDTMRTVATPCDARP